MKKGEIGIVERALSSLGKGFDITSDFRLKYCKGDHRLVTINETQTRDLLLPGFGTVPNVPIDIKSDKADRIRFQSDILGFNQMSEIFNKECSLTGKIPSGLFNAMFGYQSGSWAEDTTNTKWLGLDGYYIGLFNMRIDRYPLVLSNEVRNDVPSFWDPSALAKFIKKYGTHIVVGLAMGGHDVVLVRQDRSSSLEASELKRHLQNLGDQLFSGACNYSPAIKTAKEKVPQAFTSLFNPHPSSPFTTMTSTTKSGITVICSKRGGDPTVSSHNEWLLTVPTMPDAIHLSFIPITSLLGGVLGKGFLFYAINLYMRYKPPISELEYFLDFQGHKIWAPIHNDHALGPATNQAASSTPLQLNLLGPKLYVNSTQVIVGKRPVVGIRLYLEGRKCNRLALHLQHLSNTPVLFENKIDDSSAGIWKSSDELSDDRFLEPIQWKRFSHVCTCPVEFDPNPAGVESCPAAFIVTGAQLYVKKHGGNKSALHLKLQYSKVSNFIVVQYNWLQHHYNSSESSQRSGFLSAVLSKPMSGMSSSSAAAAGKEKKVVVMDSSVYPDGPPVPVETMKLVKFVDLTEVCRGPENGPGYWLVTGAKLDMEKGKICLQVKFSLLNISS